MSDGTAQSVEIPAQSSSSPHLALAPEVSIFHLDDELVVHDSRSGEVFVLNHTAARICALCDGANTVVGVAQVLTDDFGLLYQEALTDVEAFVADLRQARLLTHA